MGRDTWTVSWESRLSTKLQLSHQLAGAQSKSHLPLGLRVGI